MSNPAIPREEVHRLAEICGNDPTAHQPTATRLLKEQRRLSRFFEENVASVGPLPAQVALYMLSVTIRIFEQVGGRLGKVTTEELDRAVARVAKHTDALLPADKGLAERAKAIEGRAQPHILDEILWALYEREEGDKKDGESELDPTQSALVYILLWTAVEALDASWKAPASLRA